MSDKKFNLDEWWARPKTKRIVGAIYSLGASVVIIGAMFKILHLPGAGITLGLGMVTEAFLFAIGILDKPLPEYHWDHVFPSLLAKDAQPMNLSGVGAAAGAGAAVSAGASPIQGNVPTLDQSEMDKLTNGIKNLSETANQLSNLSSIAASSDKLGKSMEAAAGAAETFVTSQTSLTGSYQTIAQGMEKVAGQTSNYATNVEAANTHLSSINSVYELQLKNVQAQAELFGQQREKIAAASGSIDKLCGEVGKLQQAATEAANAGEKYKAGVSQLSQQIADLNKVYGNMLNALN